MKPILSIVYVECRKMFFLPSTLYLLSYPTVAPGTKSIDIPGYGIYKDIELVETLTSREFS